MREYGAIGLVCQGKTGQNIWDLESGLWADGAIADFEMSRKIPRKDKRQGQKVVLLFLCECLYIVGAPVKTGGE